MHRNRLAIALICLSAPCLASAATAKKVTKKSDLPDCATTVIDGSNLSEAESDYMFSIQKNLMTAETLGFALGTQTLLGDYYKLRKGEDFNANVLQLKEMAKEPSLAKLMYRDFKTNNDSGGLQIKDHEWSKETYDILYCRVAAIGETAPNQYNTYAASYLKKLQAKQNAMHGQVGYFDVTVNDCTVSKSVDTGNRFTTVKPDPDARFVTVNATFKNTDNEGRLPVEGSLLISMDGKDYKFDTTESILGEGYGIRMRSLNPLIKLNTKIVYKVPNELSGDVYWKPGRNAEDKKLWCTYLPSA
ncbi:hypothetical protein ALP05_00661 [Pseudomonas caricapapayae]|uniref:Uncharacterized protein n=1 Tax=Pseudomonas caricapapayae TaxID=46678 RepID=A0A3M6F7A9_9PSED|nr:DUF4352 domain-containing protein [Pseudomonas caricapapayae]RMV76450.1 hypothetical protein ALP05_00661 [Pseudomonas caricapapayae]